MSRLSILQTKQNNPSFFFFFFHFKNAEYICVILVRSVVHRKPVVEPRGNPLGTVADCTKFVNNQVGQRDGNRETMLL